MHNLMLVGVAGVVLSGNMSTLAVCILCLPMYVYYYVYMRVHKCIRIQLCTYACTYALCMYT